MKFNEYQTDLFTWIESGSGNAMVQARAGSGKTTSLREAIRRIGKGVLYCCFNKHVKEEAQEKLAGLGAEVATLHGHGFGAISRINRVKVEPNKYRDLVREAGRAAFDGASGFSPDTLDALEECEPKEIVRLVDLVRNDLSTPTVQVIRDLIDRHDLDLEPEIIPFAVWAVARVLVQGRADARRAIDYGDMVWIPATDSMIRPRTYPWVLVDEAQDLTRAQFELARRSVASGGRMIFVGDDRQAIYGFAGADSDSFENIRTAINGRTLELPICYRCPSSHLELAQEIVPDIQAREGAPLGDIAHISEDALTEAVQDGDLVLCRVTAPLISACYDMIAAGKPARVRGRDIGKGLVVLVDKIRKSSQGPVAAFVDLAKVWLDREVSDLAVLDGTEMKIQGLEDRVSCLTVIYSKARPRTWDAFADAILAIFSDASAGIVLSTVHRAKGLEENRVWILAPDLLPHPRAVQPWQITQEQNLRYVALTRSRSFLGFVYDSEGAAAAKTIEEDAKRAALAS